MLELKDVSTQYGEMRVLRNVSLRVRPGQIVTIVGSNGAGKSTALNVISGLLKPTSGRIELDGTDITGLAPHEIVERGISQVPEGRRVFALMSVRENLLVGSSSGRARKGREQAFKRVFEIFPTLYNRRDQRAGSLSGGEQQMLAIGRGLMSNPKLLTLDELSLGLAPLITQEIFRILQQLNREGLTLLLVDQNLTQALQISDRGYVLENGRIVLEGASSDLLANEDTKRAYMGL
ncbi:MAG: ABC transporter ATP-binding protein [Betaproteobacteria bacterium]|nr:ABC transporter ATP-binding protein [Betaproteobacteria bacterium]